MTMTQGMAQLTANGIGLTFTPDCGIILSLIVEDQAHTIDMTHRAPWAGSRQSDTGRRRHTKQTLLAISSALRSATPVAMTTRPYTAGQPIASRQHRQLQRPIPAITN
jgi:hypothetical protein